MVGDERTVRLPHKLVIVRESWRLANKGHKLTIKAV